ncbi:transposable element Tcb2 transposase [Trichonephila clavipes]|nr:transposable element Tcb2 transposase [Trichonephila clavipes]
MDLWLVCHEFEPRITEDPLCREAQCMLNMLRLKHPHVGVVGMLGDGVPAQMDSTFSLKRPYDLLALMEQEKRAIEVEELKQKLIIQKEEIDRREDKETNLEGKIYATDEDCVAAEKPLTDFDLYASTVVPFPPYKKFGSRAVNHGNSPTCLNISRQTVSKLWKQFQNDGTVVRGPGQGRKRMTTASEDRYLALTARRNRKATARQLSSELAAATGAVASRQTIYRRLNEKGLYARKPRVCVLLSSQKKRDRFLIGVKNIKTGLNINGPMFSLLMSHGLV